MFRLVNIEGTIIYSQIFTLAQAMCQLSNLGALFAVIRRSMSPGTAVARDYTEAVWMLREAVGVDLQSWNGFQTRNLT